MNRESMLGAVPESISYCTATWPNFIELGRRCRWQNEVAHRSLSIIFLHREIDRLGRLQGFPRLGIKPEKSARWKDSKRDRNHQLAAP